VTELEQARAHLRETQERLAYERGYNDLDRIRFFERCTLAALSWVWDAQERLIDSRLLILNASRCSLGLIPIERTDPDIGILLF